MDMDSRMDMFEVKQQQAPDFEKVLQRLKNVEDKVPVIEKGLDDHVTKLTLWLQSLDVKHVEIDK